MSSPAIAVRAADPLSSVARLMQESGISGVPVIDAGGRPVGMAGDGDLLGYRDEARRSKVRSGTTHFPARSSAAW
jgi:CBS domain-containing protein